MTDGTPSDRKRPSSPSDTAKDLRRLEAALTEEQRTSAQLRAELQTLHEQVARLETGFKRQLEEALARGDKLETRVADQAARLNTLGSGREESMRALADTRAQLARVQKERDRLYARLTSVEDMQTATIALTAEDEAQQPAARQALPTIEELMASLSSFVEVADDNDSPLNALTESAPDMLPAEVVFPEEFRPSSAPPAGAAETEQQTSRLLVFLDADPPIKYPLFKSVTTIGRSELADIRVDGDFISRVHARVLSQGAATVVEDVASKNGIKVNGKTVKRQPLQHGDVLSLGKLHFTYIDTANGNHLD